MRHSTQFRAVSAPRQSFVAVAFGAAMMMALAQPALAQQFQAPDIGVTEGDAATFTITLPHAFNAHVRWAYKTENGTATSGDDYTEASGHVVIYSGTTTATVTVQTTEDEVADDGETFTLKLSNFQTQGLAASHNNWTSDLLLWGIPTEKTMTATINE